VAPQVKEVTVVFYQYHVKLETVREAGAQVIAAALVNSNDLGMMPYVCVLVGKNAEWYRARGLGNANAICVKVNKKLSRGEGARQ